MDGGKSACSKEPLLRWIGFEFKSAKDAEGLEAEIQKVALMCRRN